MTGSRSYPTADGCRVDRPAVIVGTEERLTVGAVGVRVGPDPLESGL